MTTCPCCMGSVRRDVWYDCKCFRGGKTSCKTCKLAETHTLVGKNYVLGGPRADVIASNIRLLGWDKDPSPGMLDYLTPGWR